MTGPNSQRFCPICNTETGAANCPECAAPTLAAGFFEEDTGSIGTEGLIAGRYRPIKLLGEGAMGTVYLARHKSMDRKVAIKTLIGGLVDDRDAVRRFYREAQAASKLTHPNTVRIYDFGIDDVTGLPFFVMEYLEGRTLDVVAYEEGAMAEQVACRRLTQVAKALVEAHEIGLIHRDLKPENIHVETIGADEHLRVLDFGLVTLASEGGDGNGSLSGMTIVGTPSYMSPEQVTRAIALDTRSDLYALGCVLHELLTDERPYDDDNIMLVIQNQVNGAPLELPAVLPTGEAPSQGLRRLHGMLVAKDREQRPECTKMVAAALAALAAGEGDTKVNAILDDRPMPVPRPMKSVAATVIADPEASRPPVGLRVAMATFVIAAAAAVLMAFWSPLFGGSSSVVGPTVTGRASAMETAEKQIRVEKGAGSEAVVGAAGPDSTAVASAVAPQDPPVKFKASAADGSAPSTADPEVRSVAETKKTDPDASEGGEIEPDVQAGVEDEAGVETGLEGSASGEAGALSAEDSSHKDDAPATGKPAPKATKAKSKRRPGKSATPPKTAPKTRPIPIW